VVVSLAWNKYREFEYSLADETFRELLRRLAKDNFTHTNAELQTTMVGYFTNFHPKLRNSSDSKRWGEDESALDLLKTLPLPRSPDDDEKRRFDTTPKAQ
jgi:hypothetical protein